MDPPSYASPLVIAQVLVFLFSVLLTLFLGARLVRVVVRWLRWSASAASATPRLTPVLSLAAAVYLFPTPIQFIFNKLWAVVAYLLVDLPQNLQQRFVALAPSCRSDPELCLHQATAVLSSSWTTSLATIFERIDFGNFPIAEAIFFTASWILFASVFDAIARVERASNYVSTAYHSVVSGFERMGPVRRSNMLFFVILAIAAYLSLTAVIAIPTLQEPEQQATLTPTQLREALHQIGDQDAFNKRVPVALGYREEVVRKLPAKKEDETPAQRLQSAAIMFLVQYQIDRLKTLEIEWQTLRESIANSIPGDVPFDVEKRKKALPA